MQNGTKPAHKYKRPKIKCKRRFLCVNLMSNMHTAERIEAVTRFLFYPTITSSIIHGLAEPEKRWFD